MERPKFGPHYSRRTFLQTVIPGIIAIGNFAIPAKAESQGIIRYIRYFTRAMKSRAIAPSVVAYTNSLYGSPFRRNILDANKHVESMGFTDYSYSTVHQNNYHIYYPLVVEFCSCRDFLIPIFNLACGCRPIGYISGPHLAGLCYASKDLFEQGQPEDAVRATVFPREVLQQPNGNRVDGYDGPLVVKGDNGSIVQVDYEPSRRDPYSGGFGRVLVEKPATDGGQIFGTETTETDYRFTV